MKTKNRKLSIIFIPGLGDRGWLYNFTAPIYRIAGFSTFIHVFGWENDQVSLEESQNNLRVFIAKNCKNHKPFIVGISAGGAAAIWALQNNWAKACATIATPFEAISRADRLRKLPNLVSSNKDFLNTKNDKILSIFGKFDQIVPTKTSAHKNVKKHQVFAIFHSFIISFSLIFKARLITTFFKNID